MDDIRRNELKEALDDFKARVSLRDKKLKESKDNRRMLTEDADINNLAYNLLSGLLNDKFESIANYNSIITSINDQEVIDILQEIVEEEYIHIGQLQKILLDKAPVENAEELVDQGAEEVETQVEESLKESLIPNEDLLNKLIDVFAFDKVNKVVTKDNKYVLLVDKSDNEIVGYLKVNDLKTKDFDELFKLLNNQNKISGIIKNKYKSELTESNEELLGEAIKNKWKTEFYYDDVNSKPEEIWHDTFQHAKDYCEDELIDLDAPGSNLIKINILKSNHQTGKDKILNTWLRDKGWKKPLTEAYENEAHEIFQDLEGMELVKACKKFADSKKTDFKKIFENEILMSEGSHAGEFKPNPEKDIVYVLNNNNAVEKYLRGKKVKTMPLKSFASDLEYFLIGNKE